MARSRPYVAAAAAIFILILLWNLPRFQDEALSKFGSTHRVETGDSIIGYQPGKPKPSGQAYTKTIVVARQQSEDVTWLETSTLNITKAIYVVDNPALSPDFTVPKNKGHEAMVYLSYIIDHYDNLSDVSMFVHSHHVAWHNNDLLDSNMLTTIEHLSEAHVTRQGYFNLRCHHEPGCPDWLHLDRPDDQLDTHRKMEERAFSLKVWNELHPNVPAPKAISQPCCAQFAVSRDRIRANPRAEYIRYRDWLLHTDLDDVYSGRVMEYSWQFIFAGVAELCPAMHVCHCDGYGICFGGAAQLQEYFDIRENMRKLQAEIPTLAKVPADAEQMRARIDQMDETLSRLKQEAFDRGRDPRLRALEVGRPWQLGGGY